MKAGSTANQQENIGSTFQVLHSALMPKESSTALIVIVNKSSIYVLFTCLFYSASGLRL